MTRQEKGPRWADQREPSETVLLGGERPEGNLNSRCEQAMACETASRRLARRALLAAGCIAFVDAALASHYAERAVALSTGRSSS